MQERNARQGVFVLVALVAVALGLAFVIRMAQPSETPQGTPLAQVWPTSTSPAQASDTTTPLDHVTDTSNPLAQVANTGTPSPLVEDVYPLPTWPSPTPVSYPLPTYVPETLPPPSPTPTWPTPTDWPTNTPTPVVTSIPTAELPIIPEALEREEQPFWFIYWEGNQIWRVDDQGNDRELLLDVQEELGQFIEGQAVADFPVGYTGPRVVVSPDGQAVAINSLDRINLANKREPYTWSIYVFDIATHGVQFIGEGNRPYWSPDGQHFAYYAYHNGTALLYVVDVPSGEVRELARGDEASSTHIVELAWSPDSQHIAYAETADGMSVIPQISVLAIGGAAPSRIVYEETGTWVHGVGWTRDGQGIRFISARSHDEADLCEVSLATGDLRRLTNSLYVMGQLSTPYDGWATITAGQSYEQDRTYYNAWLLRDSDAALYRVTPNDEYGRVGGWTPDGTRMLLMRGDDAPALWSPAYGTVQVIDFLGDKFAIGGIK